MTSKRGFTLVELLVTIAIIGILSSVVITSLSAARRNARDARRRADMNSISKALLMYYNSNGTFVETGSGCGSGGAGQGWFNYSDGNALSYPLSIARCLINAGYMSTEIIDPTGARAGSSPTNTTFTYMKYHCGTGAAKKASVLAKLENVPQSITATDGSCCTSCDSSYGMNYYVDVKF